MFLQNTCQKIKCLEFNILGVLKVCLRRAQWIGKVVDLTPSSLSFRDDLFFYSM